MFFFKRDLKSLSDAEVAKEYGRDKQRRQRREKAKHTLLLVLFFGGMALGVGAMAATGLLAVGGGDALVMAFCGAFIGCLGTLGIATQLKPLNDWIDAKDINAVVFEHQERVKQQRVLSPAAAEAFAASIGDGVKEDVKAMKPLKLKPPGKTRRGAGFNTAFQ